MRKRITGGGRSLTGGAVLSEVAGATEGWIPTRRVASLARSLSGGEREREEMCTSLGSRPWIGSEQIGEGGQRRRGRGRIGSDVESVRWRKKKKGEF